MAFPFPMSKGSREIYRVGFILLMNFIALGAVKKSTLERID
jgi:hypothetical protein